MALLCAIHGATVETHYLKMVMVQTHSVQANSSEETYSMVTANRFGLKSLV
jgi:hypothetical protein